MAYHDFIPYSTKAIAVRFKCEKCGAEIEEEITVPWPDMKSDTDTIENDSIQCPECENEYSYSIVSYGDLEIEGIEDDEVNFVDIFYEPDESEKLQLVKKWNSWLLRLKEPSKKVIELVLGKDSSKDVRIIRNEWFKEKLSSKDNFFKKLSSEFWKYEVQSMGGRTLLTYYIKDADTAEFENDMNIAWDFLEDCYDDKWWIKEYGKTSEMDILLLEKSKCIITAHYRNRK